MMCFTFLGLTHGQREIKGLGTAWGMGHGAGKNLTSPMPYAQVPYSQPQQII